MKYKKGDQVKLKSGLHNMTGTVLATGKKGFISQINLVCVKWLHGGTETLTEKEVSHERD